MTQQYFYRQSLLKGTVEGYLIAQGVLDIKDEAIKRVDSYHEEQSVVLEVRIVITMDS